MMLLSSLPPRRGCALPPRAGGERFKYTLNTNMYTIHITKLIRGVWVMHLNHTFAFLAVVLFFCASASSAYVEVPSDIYFFEKPAVLPVEIVNDSSVKKSLSVEFYAPIDFEFVDSTDSIHGDGSQRVAIVMHPRGNMINSTYLSTLIIKVGDQTFVKSVNLHFTEAKKADNDANKSEDKKETGENTLLSGFFSLFAFDLFSLEFVLDILLVVIAAILLIAFISRYSKRSMSG